MNTIILHYPFSILHFIVSIVLFPSINSSKESSEEISLQPQVKTIILSQFFMLFSHIMEQGQKRILRNNVIKFVIWLLLLGFSYGYMVNHPAEKASIFSGFQVLRQRVSVFVHQVIKSNPEALKQKYDYEKTYEELVKMWESTSCVDPNVMTTLNETFLKLKKEPIKTLDVNLPEYMRLASEYKHMIETCSTK